MMVISMIFLLFLIFILYFFTSFGAHALMGPDIGILTISPKKHTTHLELYILRNPHFFNIEPKIIRRFQDVSEHAHFDPGTYMDHGILKMSLYFFIS